MPIDRVMGIETEYGISRRSAQTKEIYRKQTQSSDTELVIGSFGAFPVDWQYAGEQELPDVPDIERIWNRVLVNGARFYDDHGHPEYSTPECTSPRQLVIHDKAGERIVNIARSSANEVLRQDPQTRNDAVVIYKNNVDSEGTSFGCHENYLMLRGTSWVKLRDLLIPFLVTRQIFTGAGKIGIDYKSDDGHPVEVFQLSQRPDFFSREEGSQTMYNRPLINTRDEPHADPLKYRRLHVIVGDANLSPWSTYLKVGTTILVLDLIEDGVIGDEVRIKRPVGSFKSISRDQDQKWRVVFTDGRTGTALDVQELYLNRAKQLYSSHPMKREVIDAWESILDSLRYQDTEVLSTKLDYAIKRRMLDAQMRRHGLGLTSPQIRKLDLRYHNVNPEEGLFYSLAMQGFVDMMGISEDEITHSIQHPPEDTRAYLRGECVRKFPDSMPSANWDLIDFRVNGGIVRIPLSDPLRGTKALTEGMLDRSKTVEELLDQI